MLGYPAAMELADAADCSTDEGQALKRLVSLVRRQRLLIEKLKKQAEGDSGSGS